MTDFQDDNSFIEDCEKVGDENVYVNDNFDKEYDGPGISEMVLGRMNKENARQMRDESLFDPQPNTSRCKPFSFTSSEEQAEKEFYNGSPSNVRKDFNNSPVQSAIDKNNESKGKEESLTDCVQCKSQRKLFAFPY